MKRIYLILTLLVCHLTPQAQGVDLREFEGEVNWSEDFSFSLKSGTPEVLGQDGRFLYVLRASGRKSYMEKYNLGNLRLENSVRLDLKYKKKKLELKKGFMYNNNPAIQTTFYNSKQKMIYTFMQVFDKSTLLPGDPVIISKTPKPKMKGIMNKIASAYASDEGEMAGEFYVSESNELGFGLSIIYEEQEDKDSPLFIKEMNGKLFDEKMGLIAEANFEFPTDIFQMTATKVADNGLIYFAGYEQEERITQGFLSDSKRMIKGDLKIFILEVESGKIESIDVGLEDRKVSTFTFRINDKGELVIAGLTYSADVNGISGSFYARFNASYNMVDMNYESFDKDFYTLGWSDSEKEKYEKRKEKAERKGKEVGEPGFSDYYVRDLVVKPDGTSTLLAEQYYVKVVTTTSTTASGSVRTRTTYYYYYKDVIVINFDPSGEILWQTVIDKYQVSTNDGGYYSSFFTVLDGNEVNLIYNVSEASLTDTDDMKRREVRKLKRNKVAKRTIIMADGEIKDEKLFDFEESMKLVPKVCSKAGDDIVFLYARSSKNDRIGTMRW